jgi:hypothetical protein
VRAWWIGRSAPRVTKATPEMIEQAANSLARRYRRQVKRDAKHQQYRMHGLNGPRAVARRSGISRRQGDG